MILRTIARGPTEKMGRGTDTAGKLRFAPKLVSPTSHFDMTSVQLMSCTSVLHLISGCHTTLIANNSAWKP